METIDKKTCPFCGKEYEYIELGEVMFEEPYWYGEEIKKRKLYACKHCGVLQLNTEED
jgi:DNA-directed RNA polymerase subunit RPC12/RpoP